MTVTLPPALHRGRDLVRPALQAAVDGLHPAMRRVVGYHLGWCDADGVPLAAGGGKALRPALALLSAEAAGAAQDVGVPAAVAVECVHNFSLLHDDVMDGDTERRHRATAWTVFGTSAAVLAGDALLVLAHQVLLESGGAHAAAAAQLVADATQELVAGQVDDLDFESRRRVALDECLGMAGAKTGSLLSCAASIGAVLAGAPPQLVDGLAAYGAQLGLAFQLVDDLLGIWGDPRVTGKPAMSDLRARKKSVPVVVALATGGETAARLASLLAREHPTANDVDQMARLVALAGGRDWTSREALRRLTAAEECLASLSMPDRVRAELIDVARFVTAREL